MDGYQEGLLPHANALQGLEVKPRVRRHLETMIDFAFTVLGSLPLALAHASSMHGCIGTKVGLGPSVTCTDRRGLHCTEP